MNSIQLCCLVQEPSLRLCDPDYCMSGMCTITAPPSILSDRLFICCQWLLSDYPVSVFLTQLVSILIGKTPEEIRKTFNIKNDFTPEEEEQVSQTLNVDFLHFCLSFFSITTFCGVYEGLIVWRNYNLHNCLNFWSFVSCAMKIALTKLYNIILYTHHGICFSNVIPPSLWALV